VHHEGKPAAVTVDLSRLSRCEQNLPAPAAVGELRRELADCPMQHGAAYCAAKAKDLATPGNAE
jgi:hypothetical protein